MKAMNSRFRAHVLGTTALVALGSFTLGAGSASALPPAGSCSSYAPGAGETVTCSGYVGQPVIAQSGAANVTVNLDKTANLYANGFDTGIEVHDGGKVTLNGDSESAAQVYVSNPFARGIFGDGENTSVTLNGASVVEVYGIGAAGIVSYDGGKVTLNNTSAVQAHGLKYATGIATEGTGSKITLNDHANVSVYAEKYATGISAYGDKNTITLNGQSSVNVTNYGVSAGSVGTESIDYGSVVGIGVNGDGNTVSLNGGSSIHVSAGGNSKYIAGILVSNQSIEPTTIGGGSSLSGNTVVLNDTTSVVVDHDLVAPLDITTESYAPSLAVGGILAGGSNNNITLNDQSSVTVNAENSESYVFIGVGSGFLSGTMGATDYVPVSGNTITLNGSSRVDLNVNYSAGFLASGIAVAGYDNKIVLNDNASVNVNATDSDIKYVAGATLNGPGNTLTLNGSSSINVRSDYIYTDALHTEGAPSKYLSGVDVQGDGTVTLNGNSSINVSNYGSYARGYGVRMTNDGNVLTLNGHSSINVYGDAVGVGISGSFGDTVTLAGNSSIYSAGRAAVYAYDTSDLTITINENARASGEFGIVLDNSDFANIYVAGTVTGRNDSIDISGNNNTLTLDTGAAITGDIYADGGNNSLVLQGHGRLGSGIESASISSEVSAEYIPSGTNVYGFQHLTVNGDGIWNLDNYTELADGSGEATINSGTLAVNGTLIAPGGVTVEKGGTLGGSGDITGDIVNYGTISPGNSPGTLHVTGDVGFGSGSEFFVQTDGTTADLLDVTGNVTIDPTSTVKVEFLNGVDGYEGDIITATGTVTGNFGSVNGGALTYTPGVVSLHAMSPTSVNAGLLGGAETGFTFLDAVNGQARQGIGHSKGLWATGVAENADRNNPDFGSGFYRRTRGLVFGGDVYDEGSVVLGVAAGYLDTTADANNAGSKTDINGYHLGLYGSYTVDGSFLTGAVTGAYQDQSIDRHVLSGGTLMTATSSPNAYSYGAGLVAGHAFPIQGAWTLTPTANIGYQHVSRDGYSETGGGAAAVSVTDQSADTLRAGVGAELGLTIHDPASNWTVRPSLKAGVGHEWQFGDSTVSGNFLAMTNGGFTATLDTRDQNVVTAGAGVDAEIGNGVTAFASYDGKFGEVEKNSLFTIGVRLTW